MTTSPDSRRLTGQERPGSLGPNQPNQTLSATEIVQDIRDGRRSAVEIAEQVLCAIDAYDGAVQAYEYVDPALVRAQAAALANTAASKPLHGVPVAVKDVIATKDMPTTFNTPRYAALRTGFDAACVDTLRSAGAVIVGKTVSTEFAATSRGGRTRNPLDLTRTPGGSSSGSAAAVAARMCSVAVGTQTGGSVIRPASFTGIFGWKPTWNAVSREGVKVLSLTCDTVGFLATSADDLALLADVFEVDDVDTPSDLHGVRIGLCRTPQWERTEPSMKVAFLRASDALRAAGALVDDAELPERFTGLEAAASTIIAREGHAAFLNEVRANPALGGHFVDLVSRGRTQPRDEAAAAYVLADECRAEIERFMTRFDVLLAPSAMGEAPLGLDSTGDSSINVMWTLLQVPVVTAPGVESPNGLPLGMSFVAKRYHDRLAIAVAGIASDVFRSDSHRTHTTAASHPSNASEVAAS